ncbi:hypothetical protein H5410_011311 [Solanum commersonii]|uniref:Uncharacterized protein n=1 Tax=Solanum commersonii TaxID=4109 RepID=A0A9J6AN89_SOLCO|nr:hypothetical protein H5410_011311 [Solanum commersonii]
MEVQNYLVEKWKTQEVMKARLEWAKILRECHGTVFPYSEFKVMPFSIWDALESWSSWEVDKSIKNIQRGTKDVYIGISTFRNLLRGKCLVSLFGWSKLTPVNNLELFLDFVSSIA